MSRRRVLDLALKGTLSGVALTVSTGCEGAADAAVGGRASRVTVPAAINLMNRMKQYSGRYILAAQQQDDDLSSWSNTYLEQHNGGHLPAIHGWDMPIGGVGVTNTQATLNRIVADWEAHQVIPTISQHWTPAVDGAIKPGNAAIKLSVPIDDCLVLSTVTGARYARWKNTLAGHLALPQAHGVPVLLRPFHEAGGDWFWWSKGTPEQYVRLWRDLWTDLVLRRGLTNLLWVWSAGLGGLAPSWYPGDDVVDVVGGDYYDATDGDYTYYFNDLLRYGARTTPRALPEVGYVPDPKIFAAAPVAYALTWPGSFVSQNSDQALAAFYGDPRTVTSANVGQFLQGTLR
jgi:mannan endo-1,4-beta-mannosidase